VILCQIQAHAVEIEEIIRDKKRADLDTDRLLNLALSRLLEIIGEAVNRVPDNFRELHPDIPWLQMIGVRNRLIHGYDAIDYDILWTIAKRDIPELIRSLDDILSTGNK
jgi:uncharacterized protein with HEPN domain